MSGQRPPSRKHDQGDELSKDESGTIAPFYFISAGKVDAEVLTLYVKSFLDHTAAIEAHSQQKEPYDQGWRVYSNTSILQQDLAAMMEDTTQWTKEKELGNARTTLYSQSETARKRRSIGRGSHPWQADVEPDDPLEVEESGSEGVAQRNDRASASADTMIASSRPSPVQPLDITGLATPQDGDQRTIAQSFMVASDASGAEPAVGAYSSDLFHGDNRQRPEGGGGRGRGRGGGGSGGGGGGGGGSSGGGGGGQPSSTGTQGFPALHPTAGGPPTSHRYGR